MAPADEHPFASKPEEPVPLDYARPEQRANLLPVIGSFVGGWLAGVVVTGILADVIDLYVWGHHSDGGMYCVAASAIVVELPIVLGLRAAFGPRRIGALFAFLFGLGAGPVILAMMILLAAVVR